MSKICLLTNDVETTSIVNGGLRDSTGELVLKEGIPRLLDLYAKYNVKSTFFFTGYIAELFPEVVKKIVPYGHEVGCHGYTHDHRYSFDTLNLDQQITHLNKAKKILEEISGSPVVSFRAPALRVNSDTVRALTDTGFKLDSSVAPQRLDIFLTLGIKNKKKWLFSPRKPYRTSAYDLTRKGNSEIIEIPISSLGFPYIGTFMRISPYLNANLRNLLYLESKYKNIPINFLIHPNEVIEELSLFLKTERRATNYIGYLFSDLLRKKLKQKNLGINAINLYEKEINFWANKGYKFITLKEYSIEKNLYQL